MTYANAEPDQSKKAFFMSGPGLMCNQDPSHNPNAERVRVLQISTDTTCITVYRNPTNMSMEQAIQYIQEAIISGGWTQTAVNRQKWYTQQPCKCKYPYGKGKIHPAHTMTSSMQTILQEAIKTTTTTRPTHHIHKYSSTEVKELNKHTMQICPDLNSSNSSLYLDPWSAIPQHADDELLFDTYAVTPYNHKGIMSVSMGATRKFAFKNKRTGDEYHIALENGDVLFMEGACQDTCTHQLFPPPKTGAEMPNLYDYPTLEQFNYANSQRLNLTGRCIHIHSPECQLSHHNPRTFELHKAKTHPDPAQSYIPY